MRKKKRRALAAWMGALLFTLGLFTGALVAPAVDPQRPEIKPEFPPGIGHRPFRSTGRSGR